MNEARDYLNLSRAVQRLIGAYDANDRTRAAYIVMRAALLHIRVTLGPEEAGRRATQLADEMGTS